MMKNAVEMAHFRWGGGGRKVGTKMALRWWKQAVHQKRAVLSAFWMLKGVGVFEGRAE